jgi:hypothetical protein
MDGLGHRTGGKDYAIILDFRFNQKGKSLQRRKYVEWIMNSGGLMTHWIRGGGLPR